MLEAREPAPNVAFHATAPALPEPKPEPPEVERLRCQFAQCDADRAATGPLVSEEDARSEIVSVRSQPANHRPQQLVGKMLQRPPCATRQRSAHTGRRGNKNRRTNGGVGADAHHYHPEKRWMRTRSLTANIGLGTNATIGDQRIHVEPHVVEHPRFPAPGEHA